MSFNLDSCNSSISTTSEEDNKNNLIIAPTKSARRNKPAVQMVEISPVRGISPMVVRKRTRIHHRDSYSLCSRHSLWGMGFLTAIGCIFLIILQSRSQNERSYRKIASDTRDEVFPYSHINKRIPYVDHSSLRKPLSSTKIDNHRNSKNEYDAIVVGSGLAGLTATLEFLDRGGRVALIEKEATLGGNSLKASSGMNACCEGNDNEESFESDTTRSAGELARPPFIHELISSSRSALQWLQGRVGVDLNQLAQLGGHSYPRTHRPLEGMVGAELIAHLEQLIGTYIDVSQNDKRQVSIFSSTQVEQLLQSKNNRITGVKARNTFTDVTSVIYAPQVVLATGGFASDRRPNSLLNKVRPDLVRFGTTGGVFSTGDGISLATQLGASMVDLEQIQLHPTGFVDPKHPDDGTKVLAAELLRGVGGILLNSQGERFCNELGTRDYVTGEMLAKYDNNNLPTFTILLTEEAAEAATKHVDLYHRKGLLTKIKGLVALAEQMGLSSPEVLHRSFQKYQTSFSVGVDEFGKKVFLGFPTRKLDTQEWESYTFYVGTVTPVLHYCMGGVSIDTEGRVLNSNRTPIEGLYAAGEVTGGVHGKNRLGGNSLLECVIFGRKIGQRLKLLSGKTTTFSITDKHRPKQKSSMIVMPVAATVTSDQLRLHSEPNDLWMALHGWVYNLTEFADHHPGGAATIENLAGSDATEAFSIVHSEKLLEPFQEGKQALVVGKFEPSDQPDETTIRVVSAEELSQHSTAEDCWVVLYGVVYDLADFAKTHKGGAFLIQKHAGKDATDMYRIFHKEEKVALVANKRVGIYKRSEYGPG